MTQTIVYIATSLDGFIAKKNGSVEWLDQFNSKNEDYGYNKFIKSIGIILIGENTYKQIIKWGINWPYPQQISYVFSKKKYKNTDNIKFVNKTAKMFMKNLKGKKNIWVMGEANLVNQFIKADLVDELIIATIPIM